jgi:hypothetical protein
MNTRRKGTTKKILTWLVAEIVLNAVGLDTLADYSEFVFEHHPLMAEMQTVEFPVQRFLV